MKDKTYKTRHDKDHAPIAGLNCPTCGSWDVIIREQGYLPGIGHTARFKCQVCETVGILTIPDKAYDAHLSPTPTGPVFSTIPPWERQKEEEK